MSPTPTHHDNSPIVVIGPAGSVFTQGWTDSLAATGHPVVQLTWVLGEDADQPPNLAKRILYHIEWRLMKAWEKRFRRRTQLPTPIGWKFVDNLAMARRLADRALSLQPRAVLALETHTSGLVTRYIRNIPVVINVWGGDIYWYAESSPAQGYLVGSALKNSSRIITSSSPSVDHIAARFGVSRRQAHVIPLECDLQALQPARGERRDQILDNFQIPADKTIVVNSRKFAPQWGSAEALAAAVHLLHSHQDLHFVFVSGQAADTHIHDAANVLHDSSLLSRTTLINRAMSEEEWRQLMACADVFLSLRPHGDLRSKSVVEGIALGGQPVLADLPQFREFADAGLLARLVDPHDVAAVVAAVEDCLRGKADWVRRSERNRNWLASKVSALPSGEWLIRLIEECETEAVRQLQPLC